MANTLDKKDLLTRIDGLEERVMDLQLEVNFLHKLLNELGCPGKEEEHFLADRMKAWAEREPHFTTLPKNE